MKWLGFIDGNSEFHDSEECIRPDLGAMGFDTSCVCTSWRGNWTDELSGGIGGVSVNETNVRHCAQKTLDPKHWLYCNTLMLDLEPATDDVNGWMHPDNLAKIRLILEILKDERPDLKVGLSLMVQGSKFGDTEDQAAIIALVDYIAIPGYLDYYTINYDPVKLAESVTGTVESIRGHPLKKDKPIYKLVWLRRNDWSLIDPNLWGRHLSLLLDTEIDAVALWDGNRVDGPQESFRTPKGAAILETTEQIILGNWIMAGTWTHSIVVTNRQERRVRITVTRTDGDDVRSYTFHSLIPVSQVAEARRKIRDTIRARYDAEITKEDSDNLMVSAFGDTLVNDLNAQETS